MPLHKTVFEAMLNILFPGRHQEQKLRTLSLDEFTEQATPATYDEVLGKLKGSALFAYKDPLVKEAVQAVKYKRNKHIADMFGKLLYLHLLEDISDNELFALKENVWIIPIPLSKRRARRRLYNQTELIATSLAEHLPHASVKNNILTRIRDTKSQTKCTTRKERLENVRGCFQAQPSPKLESALIIVLDDVITTGATMREAVNALKNRGARNILPLAIAH